MTPTMRPITAVAFAATMLVAGCSRAPEPAQTDAQPASIAADILSTYGPGHQPLTLPDGAAVHITSTAIGPTQITVTYTGAERTLEHNTTVSTTLTTTYRYPITTN